MIPPKLRQRLFTWLYTSGAWLYDPLTILLFAGQWREWQRSVLPLVHGERILDLGCGTGQFLPDLATAGKVVVGLDRSPAMLRRARGRAAKTGVHLVRGDARALPFREGTFTTVVSTFPAEFILEQRVRDEVARVLAPGGRFLVVIGGTFERHAWWQWPHVVFLRAFYGHALSPGWQPEAPLSSDRLPGYWLRRPSRYGYASVWVAERKDT